MHISLVLADSYVHTADEDELNVWSCGSGQDKWQIWAPPLFYNTFLFIC